MTRMVARVLRMSMAGEKAEVMAVAPTLASRLAAFRRAKRAWLAAVRLKAWATLMPAMSSWRSEETSPMVSRVLRKARRAMPANRLVAVSYTHLRAHETDSY